MERENTASISLHGDHGDCTILVGERFRNLERYLPEGKTVIITDSNVRSCHGKAFPHCEVIELGTGEEIKTLDTARAVYERLTALEADRSCFIVGIGGGIVCDITGFVASTYLRGVRFGFVPTSLLAQVDASVGGKNGVNLDGLKNMVGVFSQPEFVLCDTNLLKTLPGRELSCGFAEIVKHAAIDKEGLFSFLEENHGKAMELDKAVMQKLVCDSILIKASIVERDEREKGERRKLNFGHTFGHAVEKTLGLPHGEAVSVGMTLAAAVSEKRGLLPSGDVERMEGLLRKFRLPVRVPLARGGVMDALKKDKKRGGDHIHFVLLQHIGRAVVQKIPIEDLATALDDWPSRGRSNGTG